MTRFLAFVFLSLSALSLSSKASSADAPLSVKEATRYCEKAVTELCVSKNCAAFCDASYAQQDKRQALLSCKSDGTSSKLCHLKPLATSAKQSPLEALTREELIQCIAEKRDPTGQLSGRRMVEWKSIQTPSWTKLMERPKTKA